MTCFTTHRVFVQTICIITLLSFFPSSVQAWHLLPAADREALEPSAHDVAARLGLRLLGEDRLSALDGVPGPGGVASALKLLGEEKLTRLAARTDAKSPVESEDTFAPVLAKTALKQASRAAERYTRPDHSLADAAGAMGAPVTLRKPAIDLRAHFGAVTPADGLQLAKSYIVRKPAAAEPVPEPVDASSSRYAEAEALFASGDWAGAALAALDAVDLDPASEGAGLAERLLFDLGQAARGRLWTAAEARELLSSLDETEAPRSLAGLNGLGVAYKSAGDALSKSGETALAEHAYRGSKFAYLTALDQAGNGPAILPVMRGYVEASIGLGDGELTPLIETLRGIARDEDSSACERFSARAGAVRCFDDFRSRVDSYLASVNLLEDYEAGHFAAVLEDESAPSRVKAEILFEVGFAEYQRGHEDAAAALLSSVVARYPSAGEFTEKASYYGALCRYWASGADPAVGLAAFEESLTAYPQGRYAGHALWMLSRVYWKSGDYVTALDLLNQLLDYYPTSIWQRHADQVIRETVALVEASESLRAMADDRYGTISGKLCGPEALRGLLSHFGVASNVRELALLTGAGEHGTSMQALRRAAETKGVLLRGVKVSSLETLEAPFISFVDGQHFHLVSAYGPSSVTLSSADRTREESRTTFEAGWDGLALVSSAQASVTAMLTRAEEGALVGGDDLPAQDQPAECVNGDPPCENSDCTCCDPCNGGPGGPGEGEGEGEGDNYGSRTMDIPRNDGPPGGQPGSGPSSSGDCGTCSVQPPGSSPPGTGDPGGPMSINPAKSTRLKTGAPGVSGNIQMLQPAQVFANTDIRIAVRGSLSLEFVRSYHNPWGYHRAEYSDYQGWRPYENNIGESWTHNLNAHLRISDGGSTVVYLGPQGEDVFYDYDRVEGGYTHYVAPSTTKRYRSLWHTLKQDTSTGVFYLQFPRGVTYEFSAPVQYGQDPDYCRLEKITDGISNEIDLEYDFSGAFTSWGRVTKVTAPGSDDRYIEVNYNGNDRISSVRLMADTTQLKKVEYHYDLAAFSKLTKVEVNDNVGAEVEYEYTVDTVGGISKWYISKLTDRLGNETDFTFTYHEGTDFHPAKEVEVEYASGLKTVFTKANISTNFYNVTVRNYDGAVALSKYELQAADNMDGAAIEYFRFYHGPSSSDYDEWSYDYTSNGQLQSIESRRLVAYPPPMDYLYYPVYDTWTEYTYNADGRLSTAGVSGEQTTYHYASSGDLWPDYVTDKHGVKTYFYYDGHGRQTRLAHPSTSASDPPGLSDGVTYEYDGYSQVTTVTSVLGHETHYVYDSRGNMVTKILPDDDPQSPDHPLVYEYDGLGAVITAYDALGNYTAYEYLDEGCGACGGTAGRSLGSVTDALGNTTSFEYDDNGNQITVTDALNRETAYDYDEMNRVTSVTYPGGAQATME